MDMGDFTQHWTKMFNNIHSTFEAMVTTQAVAFEKLEERFDHKLDKINASLSKLQGKSTKQGNNQPSEEDGNDGDDESDEDMDVGRDQDIIILQVLASINHDQTNINLLQDYIRSHMKALLRLPTTQPGHLCEANFPAFTAEEMELFELGSPGAPPAPSIASKTWRVDFSRGMRKCKYNAVAKREFVEHFLSVLKHGSYTERGPVPPNLRNAKMVGNCLETSFKYFRGIWKGALYDKKLRAQGSRRDTVGISFTIDFQSLIENA